MPDRTSPRLPVGMWVAYVLILVGLAAAAAYDKTFISALFAVTVAAGITYRLVAYTTVRIQQPAHLDHPKDPS